MSLESRKKSIAFLRATSLLWLAAGILANTPVEAKATYVIIDVPQATAGTIPAGINNNGDVAGNYFVYSNLKPGVPQVSHGFVRTSDGLISPFDPKQSVGTTVTRLNDSGEVAGYYVDAGNLAHGFLREADGKIVSIDAPGATEGTYVTGINAKGSLVGGFADANGSHGFIRTPGGKFTTFDVAGATVTNPLCISDRGWVAGDYQSGGAYHGFLRTPNGTIDLFDPPNSIDTQPADIDTKETIAGWYDDNDGFHGFIRTRGGAISTFDGSDEGSTFSRGINLHGVVAGQTGISSTRAFFKIRGSRIRTFSPPHSYYSDATGINDSRAITGYFYDRQGTHGYVRIP